MLLSSHASSLFYENIAKQTIQQDKKALLKISHFNRRT